MSETLGYVPVDEGAIVRDRVAGATYAELTARYGVAGGQLKTILRKYGLALAASAYAVAARACGRRVE